LVEIPEATVPFGDDRLDAGPLDAKCRVVPAHAPGRLRMIELRDLVKYFRVILQRLKPMREILWNVEHRSQAARAYFHSQPVVIGGRIRQHKKLHFHQDIQGFTE
jgi:hypothetical protein